MGNFNHIPWRTNFNAGRKSSMVLSYIFSILYLSIQHFSIFQNTYFLTLTSFRDRTKHERQVSTASGRIYRVFNNWEKIIMHGDDYQQLD